MSSLCKLIFPLPCSTCSQGHTLDQTRTHTHTHTSIQGRSLSSVCEPLHSLPLFLFVSAGQWHTCTSLCRDPTDGLSVGIWASPLLRGVCAAMPAGLELNQTHLVLPRWYRWCFAVLIRTARHQNEPDQHMLVWCTGSDIQTSKNKTHTHTHTHTLSPITQLYNPDHSCVTWLNLTDRRASSLQPQPEIG